MEAEKQRLVAQKFEQKARTGDVMIQEKTTFSGLMLAPEVLEGLGGAGFEVPSPIQLQAIPLGRAGLDLIVQAKSGTGKTCVFTVIALESINTENSCMQVVILAPTREIAVQIWEVIKSIGRSMEKLRCYVFIGGLNVNDDKLKLKKCHIAVATPGRFRQLIELDAANVNSVRLFVLDEADKLLEAGFQDDINWIYSALPTNKQMIAASATYPEYLAQQLTTYMRSPKMIRLNTCDPALLGISQYYVLLPFSSLPYKVYEEKSEFLLKLLSSVDFQQCLVFSNYQSRAQSLSKLLDSKGWPSTYICGSQEQEKRLTAMAKLRQYQCRVLISTDLTSRGIDVENVNLVVNLDLPTDHETYLHRIGRAGRYGSFGAAVTLVTQGRESADLRIIEARCQTSIQLLPDPIPEGLTHSCAKVDQNIEVTVEEAVHPNLLQDCLQVKMYEEAENIVLNETSDADVSKCTEQEFLLNDTTECEDHTTVLEDRSIGHENHTTRHEVNATGHEDHKTGLEDHTNGNEDHITGNEDRITGNEDRTTGNEDRITGNEDRITGNDHITGNEDHTTKLEDHTTEREDRTTGLEDRSTGHEGHTAENEDHTTGHEDHTAENEHNISVHEDHTTEHEELEDHSTKIEDHTIEHEDHTIEHEDHTVGHEDHITGNEDNTTKLEDSTTEHDETSVKSSANKVTPPAIDNKAQSAHVAVNGTLNVNSLCTFNIQHEGKSNESKAFAVGTDKPQEECSSAFLSGKNDTAVNDSESGNASRNELEALEKNGIVDDLGKNEVDTLNKSEIASFKADDVSSNESGDVPGNVLDITNGVGHDGMKIEVDDSNKQLNASDSLTTKIQPRGNHVERNLAWCSFLKETLPVSEQVLSLGELVSINKSYVSERNGDVDAGESDSNPKWMAEDLALPTDESVFEDIGRLIVNSDYSYATRFPCSAKLLGDMLDTETLPDFTSTKETFVSSDERRVNLSSGDTILQNSSAVEHLPNIETGVVQSVGDAFAQNFSGEECLPKKESQAAETTVKKEQTSDLQSVPKNVNTSSGTTHQEAKASRRVKWRREQLMGMERLAHNIVISPQVERLVQELCIKRGCEYPTHDTWEPSRRGNASRGRPGTKFGGRKQNYTSNWKEPLPRSSEVFNGAVEARSSTAPISTKSATHSSSYSIAEAATPSLPSNDSIDAKYSASLTSSSRIVEAVKPSTLSVPTNDSNDTTSTLVPPNDVVDTKSIASLTSSPEALTEYRHANPVASRSTATPSTSYMTMGSASPVVTPVGCNDTRSTATWTSTLQKSSNMSSHTYYSSYQVSEQVEVHYTIAEIKLPHMQSNQTMPTTVFEEPLVAVSSYPLSKTGKPSQSSDEQPMSYEPNEGESSIEPECDPVTLVSQSKYEQTEVILEESADTMLSWPASDEFTCIPDTSEAVHENHFQEIPVEMCRGSSGKFSELPCDSSSSPLPPREPLRLCTQVADEGDNQSLGRDYMLKLSACRDVIESSSDTSDVIESGFQDEFGELHWKPSAKQTRKKSSAEKKKRMSTSTKDQAGQTQHTKEHRENQRTTKVQKAASKECGINRDMTSSHEVHRSHRFHDDFVPQQPFQGWTHHKTHSHRDSASTRKVLGSRASAAKVEHSIPEQSFPGYANLDAYSSYYWNSYMAHLHNAEHFRQLLTSLTDQTRLQDIAVQQAAYIQHMIAFHRTS